MAIILLTSSQFGISLEFSNDNLIEENTVAKNSIGFDLDRYSLSNQIFRNNFDNSQNVISKSATWYGPLLIRFVYLPR